MYQLLLYAHLFTVAPCLFIGAYLLVARKATPLHRIIGKIYMFLMFITAIISLFLPAHVGPIFLHHFGFIHCFSLLTLYSVPTAIIAIRKGDVVKHKRKMIGLYVGGLLIAGGFTLLPGRFLHDVFFS